MFLLKIMAVYLESTDNANNALIKMSNPMHLLSMQICVCVYKGFTFP